MCIAFATQHSALRRAEKLWFTRYKNDLKTLERTRNSAQTISHHSSKRQGVIFRRWRFIDCMLRWLRV